MEAVERSFPSWLRDIYTGKKKYSKKSQELIVQYQSLLGKHLNDTMKQYIGETIMRNQAQLKSEVKKELEELFKTDPVPFDDMGLQ